MFDKFGEFDSFSEINELAENLLNEGDIESIKVVAKENGIQADFRGPIHQRRNPGAVR